MRNKAVVILLFSFFITVNNSAFCESDNQIIQEEDNGSVPENISLGDEDIEESFEDLSVNTEEVSQASEPVEVYSRTNEIADKIKSDDGISEEEADAYVADMVEKITEIADSKE